MICSQAEYEGAQREMRALKGFLSRIESAPNHPDKELGIISIYKKMYHSWEELEKYYRRRLSETHQWEPSEQHVEAAASSPSSQAVSNKS